MVQSQIHIAPAFRKPRDLEVSFHATDDDLGIFDLLDDEEEQAVIDVKSLMRPRTGPSYTSRHAPLSRGVASSSSFSSSAARKQKRRDSVSTVTSSASTSSSSGHSHSSVRRSKSSRSKSNPGSLLNQQMKNLSV